METKISELNLHQKVDQVYAVVDRWLLTWKQGKK